ncbi:MAG: hypothetical protein AB7U38_11190 [Hyphomicrobiales bacterium]
MPPRRSLLSLTAILLILSAGPAFADWKYLAPGNGDQNVHRAFAFAEKSDDRLEFACNANRRDLFFSSAQTVSKPDLDRLKAGEPTILIHIEGVGVVPLDAQDAYQRNGRLIFVTAVKPALITDLGKASQPIAAGMRAGGEIIRQGVFPTQGLQAALGALAAGCGF